LFERLLDRVVNQAPVAVPVYSLAPLTSSSGGQATTSTTAGTAVDWAALNEACSPAAGGLQGLRAERKEQQVGNLLAACCTLVDHLLESTSHKHNRQVRVVEFCGGAGYVALPLAALYSGRKVRIGGGVDDADAKSVPALLVTILDMKEQSLDIARARVAAAGLEEVVQVVVVVVSS